MKWYNCSCMFPKWKNQLNLKYVLVIGLGGLFIFATFWYAEYQRLGRGVLIMALFAFFDLVWGYVNDHEWRLSPASIGSGMALGALTIPLSSLFLIAALPVYAVFSRRFLCFHNECRAFDPAAFSLGIAGLIVPASAWLGVVGKSSDPRMIGLILGSILTLAMVALAHKRATVSQPLGA